MILKIQELLQVWGWCWWGKILRKDSPTELSQLLAASSGMGFGGCGIKSWRYLSGGVQAVNSNNVPSTVFSGTFFFLTSKSVQGQILDWQARTSASQIQPVEVQWSWEVWAEAILKCCPWKSHFIWRCDDRSVAEAVPRTEITGQCYNVILQWRSHLPPAESMANETFSHDAKGKAAKPGKTERVVTRTLPRETWWGWGSLLCVQRSVSLWQEAKSQNRLCVRGAWVEGPFFLRQKVLDVLGLGRLAKSSHLFF